MLITWKTEKKTIVTASWLSFYQKILQRLLLSVQTSLETYLASLMALTITIRKQQIQNCFPPTKLVYNIESSHHTDCCRVAKKKQNCKCVRYSINGECRVLLVATRDISKGERLYYDYNGYEHEYPTHHFLWSFNSNSSTESLDQMFFLLPYYRSIINVGLLNIWPLIMKLAVE